MTGSNNGALYCQELAHTPIAADTFAGEDIRYASAYEALEAELSKATSLSGHTGIDWPLVCSGSERILREQSKDLRVACWLTWGLFQRDGLPGLIMGLGLIRQLCSSHWVDLHPRKTRTRSGTLLWLGSRLETIPANVTQSAELPTLIEHLRALDQLFTTHLADQAPLLLPLCRRLENLTAANAGNLLATAGTSPERTLPTSGPQVIENERDAHKALRAQQDTAKPLCGWWHQQKAGDPKALRLQRTLTWLTIEHLPAHDTDGITALRGLPAEKLERFRELAQQHPHAELLIELENSAARAPFWLDGQRLAWQCLKNMGLESAMSEVELQLAQFLRQLPGVENLCFHDRTPFADRETRDWIDAHVLAPAPHDDVVIAASQPGTCSPWEAALSEAIQCLRKDGLKPAVQHLRVGLVGASSERERFHWRLSQAHLCTVARRFDLAHAQLEALERQITTLGLASWEPQLAVDVLRLLHRCAEQLPPSAELRASQATVHRQLCHLDLAVVLD